MKNKKAVLAALLSATIPVSCETLGDRLDQSPPRWEVTHPADTQHATTPTRADTSIYISAVRAPDDYDWRRDTAWDAARYELLVLKNGAEILSVPTGPSVGVSADPDLHHLIGGHLYTESCDKSTTTIGRDGKLLRRWEGRELLVGLMERDDGLWTLGRKRSGDGFILRRNGEIVLTKDTGSVLGTFHSNGYGSNGALYEDGGQLCFCFTSHTGGMESLFAVADGIEKLISTSYAATTLDAKLMDGDICVLYNLGTNTLLSYRGRTMDYGCPDLMMWEEAGIIQYKGEICAAGLYSFLESPLFFCGVGWETNYEPLEMSDGEVFTDGDRADCFCPWMSDGVLLSRNCGAFLGDRMIVALNPRDTTSRPMIWSREGILEEYEINGFLSGLEVVVSPAR